MHNAHFDINPTRARTYWHIGTHAIVAVILLILPMDFFIKIFLLIGVGLSFAYGRYQEKGKTFEIKSLAHVSKDLWHVYTDKGEKWAVQLLPQNYISDFLLILRFKFFEEKNKLPVLLLLHQQFTEQHWRCLQMIVRGNPRD